MNAREVCQRRLASQFLTSRGPERGSDVVRTLGAVQAQDYAGAKWALAQRMRAATDTDIEREVIEGHILRTHVLRPTWHFVAPEDIRWMLALTGPRVSQAMSSYNRKLELTADVFRRSNAVIAKALSGNKHLTRTELRQALERSGVKPGTGQRLGHLMMQAELDAVICSGARRGKQFAYGLLDERVPSTPAVERDAALLELTRRYFVTRGPASAQDFGWWSGLTMADVKRGIQIAGALLEQVDVAGRAYWLSIDSGVPPKRVSSAHLLPNYDEYFIGYRDRSAIGQRIADLTAVTGGNAFLANVVFVDGQLVGGWKRLIEKQRVVVDLTLVSRLTPVERQRVAASARAYSESLGTPVTVRGLNGGRASPGRSGSARQAPS